LFLAEAGHRVTLFDQFHEPRPIGSGLILQPTGLAVLAELGLGPAIMRLGQRIDRLFGRVCPSRRVVLDVRYRHVGRDSFGLAVHRGALFSTLYQAVAREGIRRETEWPVSGTERAAGSRMRLTGRRGSTAGPFDLVVDALGTRSPLGPAFGAVTPRTELAYGALWASVPWPAGTFDPHALEQRYERANTMVGVLPIGRLDAPPSPEGPVGPAVPARTGELAAFFWSLKPASYEAWRAAGLGPWKERVLRLWPETEPLLAALREPEDLTLARYAHHTLRSPVAEGLAAIGDAAHAASPQLGQGANMALLDARALAVALDLTDDIPAALALYAALRRWHVRFYQALSFGFTPFYQSDSRALPILRDRLIAPATRWPGIRTAVAALVAGTLLDPRPRLGLARGVDAGSFLDLAAQGEAPAVTGAADAEALPR